jgi:hypothetical protein
MDVFYYHFRWLKKLGCKYRTCPAGVETSFEFANKHAKIYVLIAGSSMPWIELGRSADLFGKSPERVDSKGLSKKEAAQEACSFLGHAAV